MNDYPFIFNCSNNISKPELLITKRTDFECKEELYRYHFNNFTNKCATMFKWKGLPDTIPQRVINLQTLFYGFTIIFEYKGNIYSTFGGLGGKPDYNYMPTIATIANPALNYSNQLDIDKNCVVIPNDSLYMGLSRINSYYASQLVENDQSINCSLINARLMNLLLSSDEDGRKSLNDVITDLKDGKISTAIDDNFLSDTIKSLPYGEHSTNNIVQLLEHRQYVKGSWWNEIGVQSNYNMKRESITSNENILNVDSLLPLSDDMLEMRNIAIEKINKMFGVKWSCEFSSSWAKIRNEIKVKEQIDEEQSNQLDNKSKSNQLDDKENDNENNN